MLAQARLDFWRLERDRISRKLTIDLKNVRKLNDPLQGDLALAEACVQFYEDGAERKQA